MFLAAVADAQTQPPTVAPQAHHRPMAIQYMSPPQPQKHMSPQPMMRNPIQYAPNEVAALQQTKLQQSQEGMHGQGVAGTNVFQMDSSEAAIPMNKMMMSRGYPGGGLPEGIQTSRVSAVEMRLGNRTMLADSGRQLASANDSVGSGLGGEMGQSSTKPFNEGEN
ncbi:hypothetical protein L7F22_022224 [Adiantum nelumboides]|nr:hypothetical protein [Adiantum nelumboides]